MSTDAAAVGTVTEIWRHPLKSMQGERIEVGEVTPRGLLGDRAYALIDTSDGKVVSAKHPRKWARMFECTARFVDDPAPGAAPPPVTISLPDGTVTRSDAADADAVLSTFFERDVKVASVAPPDRTIVEYWPDDVEGLAPREFVSQLPKAGDEPGGALTDVALGMTSPPETFFDLSALHMITTSALAALRSAYPDGDFDVRRFRPNFVIDVGNDDGFVENSWLGRTFAVGNGSLEVTVSIPMMRCVMTTLPQPGLPKNNEILQTVARHNRIEIRGLGTWACVGVAVDVAASGPVRTGDLLTERSSFR